MIRAHNYLDVIGMKNESSFYLTVRRMAIAYRTPWISRCSCINCTPFYLLDLKLCFRSIVSCKGTRASRLPSHLLDHAQFVRAVRVLGTRNVSKEAFVCVSAPECAVYRAPCSPFFDCDAYDTQKNKRNQRRKKNQHRRFFFLTLLSTWFIDFLQVLFFVLRSRWFLRHIKTGKSHQQQQ